MQHTVLEQKNRELVRINNDLDNFIYTASHDLKGPVANIEGLTGQLHKRLGKSVGETEVTLLTLLDQSALKLKHTINDLTEIAKVQKNMEEEPNATPSKRCWPRCSTTWARHCANGGAHYGRLRGAGN
jgi:light-regulated signal transduction histidine kinase (bacteriophytochrome)